VEKVNARKMFYRIPILLVFAMAKKKLRLVIIGVFLFFFSSTSLAMDKSVFQSMLDRLKAEDLETVSEFLDREKESLKQDPEYYVLLLNYAYLKRNKTLIVARGEPQEGDIGLREKNTGKVVGFIRQGGDEIIVNAIEQTRQALPAFSNRLDIHFGIVTIAADIKRWDIVGNQLVDILTISKSIKNQWKWGPISSMKGEPRTFMLENVQSKIKQLFRAEDKIADKMLIKVSEIMIQYYPEVIYGYSNLGVIYLATGKYDLAEKYINQALAIDPDDPIVKGNLEILKQKKQSSK
jgi:tetratricopeptide (TPR) repeat protein